MNRGQERRRGVRVRLAAVASLETRERRHASNQALSSVKNISRTGIGVETGQPPMVGHTVVLRIALGDTTHELMARTTRVQRRGAGNFHEVGLDWSSCTAEQLAFLDEVLREIENSPLS
jgi:hypothetical protein